MKTKTLLLTLSLVLLPGAFAVEPAAPTLAPQDTLSGFAQPEGVAVDPATGMAYVSNMNTDKDHYWQDTGKGFISRLKPGGELDALKWVESTPDFVLNQPKGMVVHDGRLYVADNARVVAYVLPKGRPGKVYEIPGAERLNDMAAADSGVYVSDTATGKIHRVDISGGGKHETIATIEGINGIILGKGALYAVSWTLHEMYEVDQTGAQPPKPFGMEKEFTNLDGIIVLEDGTFIVSDFMGNKVSAVSADRKTARTLHELDTPADIGWDAKRGLLYIPQLEHDKVVVGLLGNTEAAK
ncbi:MAG: hypothetical protein H3C30_10180 [Candidatus Hydrogenedentes bacterium]|nr:hypothetical protein [Candidatus Hydrogenedentota bacterium]